MALCGEVLSTGYPQRAGNILWLRYRIEMACNGARGVIPYLFCREGMVVPGLTGGGSVWPGGVNVMAIGQCVCYAVPAHGRCCGL